MATVEATRSRSFGRGVSSYTERALVLWPRLDRDRLRRTHGDPRKIARLVAQRTALSVDEIVALLTAPPVR